MDDGASSAPRRASPTAKWTLARTKRRSSEVVARKEARIVGAGRLTSLAPQATGNTDWSSVGRNDPCPCGSGKKFKKCHGATV